MSRITEIRYVGYGVPDLEAERRFYIDDWKLREVASQDGMLHFAARCGRTGRSTARLAFLSRREAFRIY
jgi:hypothetical protein